MRILKVCLDNPGEARKGDAKLISERTRYLESQGVVVDLMYFDYALIASRLIIEESKRGGRIGKDIRVRLRLSDVAWNLISGFGLFRGLPIQTWLSFGLARSMKRLLSEISQDYDAIHIYHIRSIGLWGDIPQEKNTLYDIIDSYSLNLRCRLLVEKSLLWQMILKFEYSRMRRLESRLEQFINNPGRASIVAVAAEDLEYIGSELAKKVIVPVGVNIKVSANEGSISFKRLRCIFFGNLDYEPNINACLEVKRLARAVDAYGLNESITFTVAGRNVSRRLANDLTREGITVLSPVKDMMEVVRSHNIALIPMVSGSGMQSKVLEALQWGCLLIATKKAAIPLGLEDGREYILWEDIEGTLELLARLIDGRFDPNQILTNGQSSIKHFSWESTCEELVQLYADPHTEIRGRRT